MSDELLREATRNYAEAIAAKDAEIERLQNLYDIAVADRVRMHTEIKRLRAALEHIGRHFGSAEQCRELAHSALGEADDE